MTTVTTGTARTFFPPRVLALELRRMLRNRRTVIIGMAVTPLAFLLVTLTTEAAAQAYLMVSLGVYAALSAVTAIGAGVSQDRAAGWSRQLRLSPLRPVGYVLIKAAVAMTAGALAIGGVFAIGAIRGVHLPIGDWLSCGLLAWACSVVFAAFGLAMGYLLPMDNAMQLLGPLLAVLAFAGGLFMPIDTFGPVFSTLARFVPTYGAGVLARAPLTGTADVPLAVANLLAWTAAFVALAAWRMRRDTARV
ncbi:MAG: ABC transporter permease [Pseudonocardia sp.]|nr:ABC transporter permease [Pseudonocardia sp.]